MLLCLELFLILVASCKPEVADLEVAILVDEDVAWFKVPVDDIGTVDVEQASEDLVDEILDMVISEILDSVGKASPYLLRVDHTMQVGFHEVGDDVDFIEACLVLRTLEVQNRNDVFVVKELFRK